VAELTRRGVLARAGLAAGALALGARPELAEAAPDLRDWGSVRSQFALERGRIHLTSFLLATHPRLVGEAIEAHRRRLDANPVEYLHGPGDGLSAAAREAAARFLGAPASEIALTDSTTMGLGLLYTRLALGPGTRW
jgi:selenocysteine lyase/cysteine desulfurase